MNKTLAVLLLVLALGAGITGALLLRDNKPQFEAAAIVRPVWDETDLGAVGDLPTGMETVVLLQSEAAVIRSDVVLQKLLQPTVGETNSPHALVALSERVEVIPVPGATALRVALRADSAAEAIQKANELAQAYCDYRVERRQRIARAGIASVTELFKKQAAALREAQAALAAARAALGPGAGEGGLGRGGGERGIREIARSAKTTSAGDDGLPDPIQSTCPQSEFSLQRSAAIGVAGGADQSGVGYIVRCHGSGGAAAAELTGVSDGATGTGTSGGGLRAGPRSAGGA
jgi:hypothetical protein